MIGGGLNSLYDLLLLFMFRKVRPPEEQILEDVHNDVSSTYHVDSSVTPTRSSALRAVPRPLTSPAAILGKSLDGRRQIPRERLERLSARPQRALIASRSGAKLARLPTAVKTVALLTKCTFSQNADVRDQEPFDLYSPITWCAEHPDFWAEVRTPLGKNGRAKAPHWIPDRTAARPDRAGSTGPGVLHARSILFPA